MFKKTLSAVLSFGMILTACAGFMPANAATMTVEDYAYMDIQTAPASLKDTILEAREEIIYSESWSVDGRSYITYPDGTIEVLPEFSELFPGWELPAAPEITESVEPILTRASIYWEGPVSLKAPPANTMSASFKTVPGTNGTIGTRATSFGGGTVNIGYSVNGFDHTWTIGVSVGSYVTVFGVSGTAYGVRASTNGTPGTATMEISYR